MAQSGYRNPSFPPRYAVICTTPATCTHRDPWGKPSGVRAYYPPLRFLQSTLDDLGHNRYGPMPTFRLQGFSLHPPRDTKICHTLKTMCVQQQPHATIPSVAPNMMHLGNNQKVQ